MAQPEAAGRILTIFYSTGSVYFDRGHLGQILSNLVANAWRHSSRVHGAVRIEVSQVEAQVLIHVFDDGPGMSEDAQAHLFEPFFTTESSGTGLGCISPANWLKPMMPGSTISRRAVFSV
jgi:two-component system sensor histidine kinase PilS (NtrC family)